MCANSGNSPQNPLWQEMEILVPAVVAGSEEAAARLMNLVLPELRRLVYARCPVSFYGADAVDEAVHLLLSEFILTTVPRWDASRSSLRTWCWRLASFLLTDWLRSQPGTRRLPRDENAAADLPDPACSPAEQAEHTEFLAALERAVKRLEPLEQEIFALRLIEGKSREEVALLLHISAANVGTRLYRLRADLARWLADFRPPPPLPPASP